MVLSGHTHLSNCLSYGPQRPLQIVAGDAGTKLDKAVRKGRPTALEIYGIMAEESEDEERVRLHAAHQVRRRPRSGMDAQPAKSEVQGNAELRDSGTARAVQVRQSQIRMNRFG